MALRQQLCIPNYLQVKASRSCQPTKIFKYTKRRTFDSKESEDMN